MSSLIQTNFFTALFSSGSTVYWRWQREVTKTTPSGKTFWSTRWRGQTAVKVHDKRKINNKQKEVIDEQSYSLFFN